MAPTSQVNPDEPVIEDKSLTTDDVVDILGDEDEAEEKADVVEDEKEDETETEEKDDDDDEEKIELAEDEDEDELDEPEVDEEEIVTPVRRKEILAKYPNLFKEFPYLEKAYYREQQYTELLPTIADAKEAVEKAQTLEVYQGQLLEGNIESVLGEIKKNDEGAFNNLVDNYLTGLMKVDQNAYYHVLGNIVKYQVSSMAQEARARKDQDLEKAASKVYEFIFGTTQWQPPSQLGKKEDDKNPEVDKLKQKNEQLLIERFEESRDSLQTRIDNSIISTISEYIDPKGMMTEYVKKNAIRDAAERLEEAIGEDERFQSIKDTLWEKAFQNNFNQKSIQQIRSAYMSKARTMLSGIIKKARQEALKGQGRTKKEDIPKKGGRRSATSSSKSADAVPKGMSTIDFLNLD